MWNYLAKSLATRTENGNVSTKREYVSFCGILGCDSGGSEE
jgi:hypothetical protein